jgi:hypothetical protein
MRTPRYDGNLWVGPFDKLRTGFRPTVSMSG